MQLLTLRPIGSYFGPTRHLTIQHRYAFLIAMNVAQRSLLPKEMKVGTALCHWVVHFAR